MYTHKITNMKMSTGKMSSIFRISRALQSFLLLACILSSVLALPASSTSGIFIAKELSSSADSSTCPAKNLEACPSTLPNNFCCPAKSTCIALAGDTTVLCCPSGQNCDKIRPITCVLTQQDVNENPNAPIKTTVLDGELPKCGDKTCCPFGYTCNGNKLCVKDVDQSQKPAKPTSTSSAGGEPTPTQIPDTTVEPTVLPTTEPVVLPTDAPVVVPTNAPIEPSSTESASTSSPTSDSGNGGSSDNTNTNGGGNKAESSHSNTVALVGGVIGGLGCVILMAIGFWLCYRRQKKGTSLSLQEKAGCSPPASQASLTVHKRNLSSIGHISEPIVQQNSYRTDFIRKPSSENTRPTRPLTRFPVNPASYWDTIDGEAQQEQQQQQQQQQQQGAGKQTQPPPKNITIPNPFDSPSLSAISPSATSRASDDEDEMRLGTVTSGARLAPIRAMKASSRHIQPTDKGPWRKPSNDSINGFPDSWGGSVNQDRLTRETTFTQMMEAAKLGDVHRGKPYVPGATPRI